MIYFKMYIEKCLNKKGDYMNDWKEQLKNIKIENNEKKEDLRYIDTHGH